MMLRLVFVALAAASVAVHAAHLPVGYRVSDTGRSSNPQCRFDGNYAENICPLWSYSDVHWQRNHCSAYEQCGGKTQSPIDISNVAVHRNNGPHVRPDFLYTPARVELFNTGNMISMPVAEYTGILEHDDSVFSLRQVDFHTPSEHTLYGRHYDAELQFQHVNEQGKEVNVAVMVMEGASNPTLARFIDDVPMMSECRCGNGRKESWAGEECDEGENNSNTKRNGCRTDCHYYRCGDGVIDSGEECDFGEDASNTKPNFCRTNCKLPSCGDGVHDSNHIVFDLRQEDPITGVPIPIRIGIEQCDDGNLNDDDGCDQFCQLECGNGRLDAGEQCDEGAENSNSTLATCRPDCTLARCGDGVVSGTEVCDDGVEGANVPNLCRNNCTLPTCGDGITDDCLGEECDDANDEAGDGCYQCRLECGNGVIDGDERCDDGANNDDTGSHACRRNCRNSRCGDGIVDLFRPEFPNRSFEECDEGDDNGIDGGLCSDDCTLRCGNGVVESGEECDDGAEANTGAPNACRPDCRLPVCGDGVVDDGEDCDLGADQTLCHACRMPTCGDGITDVYAGEQCDDGSAPNDRCTSTCLLKCGNGLKDDGEECDEGRWNANRPDTCRVGCSLPRCGDGIVDGDEECDDGLNNRDFEPNACRTNCRLPYCGDGVHDTDFHEACDEGEGNSDTTAHGCTSRCTLSECSQSITDAVIDFSQLLPDKLGVYTYHGSHTTPPCREGVEWIVFEHFLTASKNQLEVLSAAAPNSRRPTQPLNLRRVSYPTSYGSDCGNGIREGDEECDDPRGNSDSRPNACRTNCRLPYCGDGVVDCTEQCDGSMTCGDDCRWGTQMRGNRTVVNVFFKDIVPHNHFCCGAAKHSPEHAPCSTC